MAPFSIRLMRVLSFANPLEPGTSWTSDLTVRLEVNTLFSFSPKLTDISFGYQSPSFRRTMLEKSAGGVCYFARVTIKDTS